MSLQTDVLKDNLFDVYGCDAIFFVPTKNIVLIQYILLTEKRLFTQFLYCIFFYWAKLLNLCTLFITKLQQKGLTYTNVLTRVAKCRYQPNNMNLMYN